MHDEGEPRLPEEMLDVGEVAGAEVVDADDLVATIEQSVTQVRTRETPRRLSPLSDSCILSAKGKD